MPDALEERALVDRALAGDRRALEEVVGIVRDPVYRLALRMEWRPPDAEDATQEILIRIVTNLGSWRGSAALTTWAYRIAANHLLNRRRAHPAPEVSFDSLGAELDRSAAAEPYGGVDAELLADEVRLRCTQAMLQCLGPEERLVYVLGDIVRLPSRDAAWIVGVGDAAYRKRLQRARERVRDFTAGRCGMLDPGATCHCTRRVTGARAQGRLRRDLPFLARHAVSGRDLRAAAAELAELRSVAALMRSHPDYAAPGALAAAVDGLLRSRRYAVLDGDDR
ncbi:MAG TPA: sigma-70 family RNA polymerase sigma factor [Acidimicrobiales bacterium]